MKTNHEIIVLLHLIDLRRMGLSKEQCAEKRKEHLQCCCDQARMKNGGLIPWNAVDICETPKTSFPTGKETFGETIWRTIWRIDHSVRSNG